MTASIRDQSTWALRFSESEQAQLHSAYPNSSEQAESNFLKDLRVGVKDLFDIAGFPTAAGNPDWLASHPLPQATHSSVEKLIKAGARIVGKTQTDELAYSLNGLNQHYGAPLNPIAPNRLPGGSSSGSAVATAANEIDIGLGTDTGGSIRVPASYNGLFGIRTSIGAIACDNMVPLAPRFDTVGWMTRDAQTLSQVGDVLLPEAQQEIKPSAELNFAVILPELNGEILWQKEHESWLAKHVSVSTALPRIKLQDAWLSNASVTFRQLQAWNIWQTHGEWITQSSPRFAPDVAERFNWAKTISEQDKNAAEAKQVNIADEVLRWFAESDVIFLPTTPGPSPLLSASAEWKDRYRSQLMGLTAIAGLCGLPQVHLPVLCQAGAPMGISLLGKPGSDKQLLALAIELTKSETVVKP